MAWDYGFHNSVNGDRVYNADQLSGIFNGLISDGVYESVGDKLAVQPNGGMRVQIATGRGWFNNRWVNNTSPYVITLNASDVTLNRYAAICVRGDNGASARKTVPYTKYSDFATNPVKPTMVRTDTIKEYCLAYVYIRAGASTITASDIEDTRQDKDLCGWVTGLVDQITPDTLYTQFTAQFNEWFAQIQDDLDTNTKTMLVNALPKSVTVTLNASAWTESSDGGYTQAVSVTGMNTTKSVIVQPSDDSFIDYESAKINASEQRANSLVFVCNSLPSQNITVKVLHMGQ